VYPLHSTPPSKDKFSFFTKVANGEKIEIVIEIESRVNPFMQHVLNLAFGPRGQDGKIDDFASVKHLNYSKAFSTIIFCALTFLKEHPDVYLGIDGSDFRRAYLYYRTLQRNYDYLNDYFSIQGIKYYIRVLRGKDKYDLLSIDTHEVMSIPYNVEKAPLVNHKSLFNYFVFSLI
jgi:hypothetical protein